MRIRDTLAQVLANPALRGLQASWLLGIAAEKAYLVALLVFAYDVGGVVAVGVFTMLASLPSGLFGPVLSSVAESFAPARAQGDQADLRDATERYARWFNKDTSESL